MQSEVGLALRWSTVDAAVCLHTRRFCSDADAASRSCVACRMTTARNLAECRQPTPSLSDASRLDDAQRSEDAATDSGDCGSPPLPASLHSVFCYHTSVELPYNTWLLCSHQMKLTSLSRRRRPSCRARSSLSTPSKRNCSGSRAS
jgi:hypothetical protein